jgi:Terpene cyclase DEP1
MKNRLGKLYLAAALIALVSVTFLNAQYVLAGGSFAPGAFVEAVTVNKLTASITLDIYLAALTFCVFLFADRSGLTVTMAWVLTIVCFTLGLAVALPLYLFLRIRR